MKRQRFGGPWSVTRQPHTFDWTVQKSTWPGSTDSCAHVLSVRESPGFRWQVVRDCEFVWVTSPVYQVLKGNQIQQANQYSGGARYYSEWCRNWGREQPMGSKNAHCFIQQMGGLLPSTKLGIWQGYSLCPVPFCHFPLGMTHVHRCAVNDVTCPCIFLQDKETGKKLI